MKLVYFIQEDITSSNCVTKGVFNDAKTAFKAVVEKIHKSKKHVSFKIVECPMNKNIDGGIVICYIESDDIDDFDVLEINPVYTSGGIKKWVKDQYKAARKS